MGSQPVCLHSTEQRGRPTGDRSGRSPIEVLAGIIADPESRFTDRSSGIDPGRISELVESARRNRVAVSLALAFERNGIQVPEDLELSRRRAGLAHLQTTRALAAIAGAFDSRGITWAVVKGPAVARLWPHGSITRSYDDLDLLVSPCDLAEAARILVESGFAHRNHNWRGFTDLGVAEIPLDDGCLVVDLHWNLVALAEQRNDLHLDTTALLGRAQRLDLGGVEVPILADVDAFTHLCCHAGIAGARDLRALHDVHLAAARIEPVDALRSLRLAGSDRLAAAVIDRAVRLFGPVVSPTGAVSDAATICGHPLWTGLNRAVDWTWSRTNGRGHSTFPGAVISGGRAGPIRTARAVAAAMSEGARRRLGLPTRISEGGCLHWGTTRHHDQMAGYDDYLRHVERIGLCG